MDRLSDYYRNLHRDFLQAARMAQHDAAMHVRLMRQAAIARLYYQQHRALGD